MSSVVKYFNFMTIFRIAASNIKSHNIINKAVITLQKKAYF